MTEREINQIKKRCSINLEVERAEVISLLGNSLVPESSVGGGTFAAQYTLNQTLAKKLHLIDLAQERERQGNYGKCMRCDTQIWERLISIPYAEFCIECQRQIERQASFAAWSLPVTAA